MTSRPDKVTAIAPSNIAFLKYWGARDLDRALPQNVSLSMTLSRCVTRTTVERLGDGRATRVEELRDGRLAPAGPGFTARVVAHLVALVDDLGLPGPRQAGYRVATTNTFPSSAGIASSASGFAALATAVAALSGREVAPERLSLLARRSGSGSAARSVLGGFVEWPGSSDDPAAPARQLAPAEHWELYDLIAVVSTAPKEVSSRDGHARAPTSPHYDRRLRELPDRLELMRRAIADRDLPTLGAAVEAEAVELHLIAMSSQPPIFYWHPATLAVLERVRALRRDGVGVWATMDAGPNVHLICEPADAEAVAAAVAAVDGVERLIRDRVGSGPRPSDDHLF